MLLFFLFVKIEKYGSWTNDFTIKNRSFHHDFVQCYILRKQYKTHVHTQRFFVIFSWLVRL